MRYLILLFLCLSQTISFGQSDSVKQKIREYKNPTTEFINNARALIRDRVEVGNLEGLKDIYEELKSVESEKHIALYKTENLLLSLITAEYKTSLEIFKNWTSDVFENSSYYPSAYKIRPPFDLLEGTLLGFAQYNLTDLLIEIRTSSLNPEKKEFLLLAFEYLLRDSRADNPSQEYFNQQADIFLARYPTSKYLGYVKQQVRFKYVLSDWGWGMDFGVGYGRNTENISSYFNDHFLFGMGFDLSYKNLILYLRGTFGISSTLKDVSFNNEIWKEGSQANITIPEASIGYNFTHKNLRITPFAGIAGAIISAVQIDIDEQPALGDADIDAFAYTFGGNFDVVFDNKHNPFTMGENWMLRFRYNYFQNRFKENYLGINGNGHTFTVGIGGYIRRTSRKY